MTITYRTWLLTALCLTAAVHSEPATQPTPKYIPSGTDLSPLVASAKPGTTISLSPGGKYAPTGALVPTAIGVTLACNGATIDLAHATAKGGSTNFSIAVAHFTVDGGNLANGSIVFRSGADSTTVSNCHIAKCVTAIQTTNSPDGKQRGTNFQLLNTRIDGSKKVGVYIDQSGFTATNSIVGPSDLEYAGREEISADNVRAMGVVLKGCTFDNPRTAQNGSKDCFGFRVGDALVNWCTFHGDVRIGQAPKSAPWPKAGDYCRVTMSDCTIDQITPVIQGLAIYQGAIVTTNNLTVTALYGVSVDKNSTFSADSTMHFVPAPGPMKPLVGISSAGAHEEVHTTTQMAPR